MTRLYPRRLALYGLALVLCAVPAVFLNSLYGYLPLLMLVLLGLASAAYLALLRRGLSCRTPSGAGSCPRQTELSFSVTAENRSRLVYPRVDLVFFMAGQGEDGGTESAVSVTLAPRERREIPFHVTFDHLGEYTVGLRGAEAFGPLGICGVYLPVNGERQVLVTPRIWDLDGFPLSRRATAEDSLSRRSTAADGMDYTGVRPYIPGDPLRSIHWKLSAHTREYLTKQQEAYGSAGVTVVLDLCFSPPDGEAGLTLLDGLVESAAAVCRFVKRGGADCEIAYFDRNGGQRRYIPRWNDSFFGLVSQLPPATDRRERYPAAELLRRAGAQRGGNVVLCTAGLTEELARLLRELRGQRRQVTLLQLLPEKQTAREREEALAAGGPLATAGIGCYGVTSAEELRRIGG